MSVPVMGAAAPAAFEAADRSGDIKGGRPGDWLVTGWFTPDYRPRAENLAASLAAHGAPFHLWAMPRSERGWNTWRKPSVVLATMDAYPGKTIVLMDVDCMVRGDIAALTRIEAEIGINIKARQPRKLGRWKRRLTISASSRVVTFRPTEGARRFAREWQRLVEKSHYGGDETAFAWAYLLQPDVSYTYPDARYAGREVGRAGAACKGLVIVHDSAHSKTEAWRIKEIFKAVERRYLRTGATKAQMAARIG